MIRLAIAAFVALAVVLFSGGQASTPGADAGATTDLSLELDCDVTASGVQSACTLAPGATTTNVDIVLRNNSASPKQVGRFDIITLNPDVSRLFAPMVPPTPPGYSFDINPDAHPAVTGNDWTCSYPPGTDNDLDSDGNPSTQESFLTCANGFGTGLPRPWSYTGPRHGSLQRAHGCACGERESHVSVRWNR